MKKIMVLLAVVLTSFVAAFPQVVQTTANLTGNWDVKIKNSQGTVNEQWTLDQKTGKVTGKAKSSFNELPVEGTVNGTVIHLEIKDGDMTYVVLATADGDIIKGTFKTGQAGRGVSLLTATRLKSGK